MGDVRVDVSDDWFVLMYGWGGYFGDACVEGPVSELDDFATAIEKRRLDTARRWGVEPVEGGLRFWSPRNSISGGAVLSLPEADAIATQIREYLAAVEMVANGGRRG